MIKPQPDAAKPTPEEAALEKMGEAVERVSGAPSSAADRELFKFAVGEVSRIFKYPPIKPGEQRKHVEMLYEKALSLREDMEDLLQGHPTMDLLIRSSEVRNNNLSKPYHLARSIADATGEFATALRAAHTLLTPPGRGRPINTQLHLAIQELEFAWQKATGRRAGTSKDKFGDRVGGPFVDFVRAALTVSNPQEARKIGLGDTIKNALQVIRAIDATPEQIPGDPKSERGSPCG
ncbi:hypothetical protein [Azospirillum sp. ST 5-10]|uniref:hypothetical protein n=1 Tax=unclassified Azospirillum TaxID=2630922 RepID=UPI003F4A6B4A